ncbi:MAG: class I SAM-dependent methyltransferase [Alphaproteobacteria bacterium]|nr:class I SAM-dependent methyltransferase [Alphaproteobacteria bacterium]
MTVRPCPICDTQASTPVDRYSRDPWSVERCDDCRHVYLKNPPGYGALEENFAWQKTFRSEHERRLKESPIAYRLDVATRFRHAWFRKSTVEKYRAWFRSGNILSIGCGNTRGWFQDFTPYGIEISKELAAKADSNMSAHGGYCIFGPGAKAIWKFPAKQFDGVVMNSYLEHEEAPLTVLKGASRVLKSEGAIYVRVPNFGSVSRRAIGRKWCGFRWPDHVNYFTMADLRNIAARANLKVRLLNPLRLPFDDNINALLTHKI